MHLPVICFGQQPNGFFPKRFFYAKILTAKNLQRKIGGKIVYFFHDSDADYRETITILVDKQSGKEARLNFEQPNRIQKKFSPLYAKKIADGWQEKMSRLLPQYVDKNLLRIFTETRAETVADFCLNMYENMGLLKEIEVVRSGNSNFRNQAINLPSEFYVDTIYQNEIVRAKYDNQNLSLHEGGGKHIELPNVSFEKLQTSPGRDFRFAWMQSVINCTHYIMGAGEESYLTTKNFPDVKFVRREKIKFPERAYIEL